jgi:hypothetical protein
MSKRNFTIVLACNVALWVLVLRFLWRLRDVCVSP